MLTPKVPAFSPVFHSYSDADRTSCGTDPNRSSVLRYANHAAAAEHACNTVQQIDPHRGLIWLKANRKINPGEEIQYDYSGGSGGLVGPGGVMLMHSMYSTSVE